MNFTLERFCDSEMGTFGRLTSDSFSCYTIEQPWRNNLEGHSCIPSGTYTCKRGQFPKHGDAFEVMNVPGRTAILIHSGNVASNFEGCIGLGDSISALNLDGQFEWAVLNSVKTVSAFMAQLSGVDEFQLTVKWKEH